MRTSVVVITRDEAERLRLVLASLDRQAAVEHLAEIIIIDDGSRDGTRDLLASHTGFPKKVIRHAESRGRSAARNAGALAASGDLLLFLDGDCLASPRFIAMHAAAHAGCAQRIGRGENYHLRCTRFLRDPERGTPMVGQEQRVARLGDEVARSLVTKDQVLHRFGEIEMRAEPGIYPGGGPRRLEELELRALDAAENITVSWMAAAGHNLSIPRAAFLDAGGFDERLEINEHRELAFRLHKRGLRMARVSGARTYHLTHRTGWRDPLAGDLAWEQIFFERHPCLETKLMTIFWLSLAGDPHVPAAARIHSLEELEAALQGKGGVDYDAIRRAHPRLPQLVETIQQRAVAM